MVSALRRFTSRCESTQLSHDDSPPPRAGQHVIDVALGRREFFAGVLAILRYVR